VTNYKILQIVDVYLEYKKEIELIALLADIMPEKEKKTIILIETKHRVENITRHRPEGRMVREFA
jgi:superfamily II DNA/RNA helicase